MDLFDVNCFLGRWPTEASLTPDVETLRQELDRIGVRGALVRHTWGWWYDPIEGNQALLRALEGHPELRPCLAAAPLPEDVGGLDRFLAHLGDSRAGAVCLYPQAQRFSLSRPFAGDLLDALAGASVPVLLQLQETSWEAIQEVLVGWPGLPLVVARGGYRILRYLMPLLQTYPNLYVDIAYLADNLAIEHITTTVGPERLLFGTGTPLVDGAGSLARLMYSTISDSDKELIASGNARRLLAGVRLPQAA
ncbi:MAG: amidohydrolase family protein [Anaerolineae bacterium]|nr:amidohydrolase family protein [Anaerolineae bacterium]